MRTEAEQLRHHEDQAAGTFRLTPEEVEELDHADAEADEADRTGTWIPIEEVLAKLRRS